MARAVIKVDNVSKKYLLGSIGTGTLRHDLNRWWALYRGKEDPYSLVSSNSSTYIGDKEFWALKDVNFSINQGDAVGIIGKNGAGKSTLLKLLSRVTSPSSGEIKIKGRIASLLEVGTGFHPELSGKENIFLNGAILGMTKREIRSKLDEIVHFSGIEKHIETPVKRYSSGMYVRLAFAVAAHLEPEILIVDEVLAVGDAEFQKKCLGKMNQVAGEGRTVLFVSHNMGAIRSLCTRGIFLDSGKVLLQGSVDEVATAYGNLIFNDSKAEIFWKDFASAPGNDDVRIMAVRVLDSKRKVNNRILDFEEFYIEIDFINQKDNVYLTPNIQLFNSSGVWVLSTGNWASVTSNQDPLSSIKLKKGYYKSLVKIPSFFLNEGSYYINALVFQNASITVSKVVESITFNIVDSGEMRKEYSTRLTGVVRPKLEWQTRSI